ncbi:MAG: hypothetical protein OXG77_06310 [Chloroflexi bacterium]|nr:hypothetical protein [Chloroflexota bacterium]
MENSDGRLLSETTGDRGSYLVVIARKRTNAVALQIASFIPPVIPEVVHKHVKVAAEEGPKRVVEVDGETISVAQNQSGAVRVSVASYGD